MSVIQRKDFLINRFFNQGNFWQKIFLFIVAVSIWLIFYPGLMSPDSVAQYEEALGSYFNDWHPPLMSIVLWFIMKLKGDIGTLIFIQCVAAIFGLRTVFSLTLQFFSSARLTKPVCRTAATVITLIFLIPLFTPFMFYSVIFWKDAWVAIFLLWIISYLFWIFLNLEIISKRNFILHLAAISLILAFLPLVRHNTLTVLPILCICLMILSKIKFGRVGLLAFILPLLLTYSISPLVYKFFDVQKIYLGNTVLASDLATMVRLYPEMRPELPIATRHQNSPIVLAADIGLVWDDSIAGADCPYIKCENSMLQECYGTPANTTNINGHNCYIPVGTDNPGLKAEYLKAFTYEPAKFISTKLNIFWQMLHPRNWDYAKFESGIYQNNVGLINNSYFAKIRGQLINLSTETGKKIYFNWISGMHILWLVIDFLFAFYLAIKYFLNRTRRSLFILCLFLIPLSYYFSYILAATTSDYRFMYPATLTTQILVVSIITSRILMRSEKHLVKINTANYTSEL